MGSLSPLILLMVVWSTLPLSLDSQRTSYFIHQCHRHDPDVNLCLKDAANHLVRSFKTGIPELGYLQGEPIAIEEMSIALAGGPDGYRCNIEDIEVYGLSNLTVVGFRSDLDLNQFQLSLYIPKISVKANFSSSGSILMVRASGGGDYWGEYEGVKAKIYFRASPQMYKGRKYLLTEEIKMDFNAKDLKMGIENIRNGNIVIQAALNLLMNNYGQELLKEMKPEIIKNIIRIMKRFLDNLFTNIPYDMWMLDS